MASSLSLAETMLYAILMSHYTLVKDHKAANPVTRRLQEAALLLHWWNAALARG